MTTMAERVDPLELDLQSPGSTGVYYYAPVLTHLDRVSRSFREAARATRSFRRLLTPAPRCPVPPVPRIPSPIQRAHPMRFSPTWMS